MTKDGLRAALPTNMTYDEVNMISVKKIEEAYLSSAVEIWNEVVEEGNAFPQTELLTIDTGREFFAAQSFTGIALDGEECVGVYILHPNNVGRCGHICNASFAVKRGLRGRKIGERLVLDCMEKGRELGFKILQFNAVVADNLPALRLYERLGFTRLGVIPEGFLSKDGAYRDIIVHYHTL